MVIIYFKIYVSYYSYMYLINCDLLIKNESEFFNGFIWLIDGLNIDFKYVYFFRFNYIILKIFMLCCWFL